MKRLPLLQSRILSDISRMNSWGGYYATDYQIWKVIKRLHAKRLVKRADRCRHWADQFWYVTQAGEMTLLNPQENTP